MEYDVIVVGARCAGAPTAMLFARAGHRVLLLERAAFPADTLSTLYIQQPGVARLRRWGLLDAVRATGCPPLDHVVYALGDVRVEGCAGAVDGVSTAYAPRRRELDRILVDGAVAAGAEFRDRCPVGELLVEDGRVTGVVATSPGTGPFTARAPLVVGADGMRSTVARLAGAGKTTEHPRLTCAYYTFWAGVEADFELYEGPTGWVSAVPTAGAVLVSAYFPQDRFDEVRSAAATHYEACVRDNAPALWARLEGAATTERLRGTGDQQNFFRTAAGPGWALVGDAGHHKDSITARGIGDAFLQAELLTGHVGTGLHDPRHLDKALAAYGADRDAQLADAYRGTLLVAGTDAREQRRALLRAVSTSADLTQRYFDTVAGVRPVSELYTPELQALLATGA
ncbi:NAD(P)/FAD-dependent oxidoreductase [Streptomyces specialis]|uniref:NAD(P)/FAD-dependent oxidoreductase n=1 Tax=Streptomyces specialis TaxID=498367 RepID=UPI00073F5DE5|nr:NAD(P)/FAD-dependent oxidoreductase [Streptomyces specialis]